MWVIRITQEPFLLLRFNLENIASIFDGREYFFTGSTINVSLT